MKLLSDTQYAEYLENGYIVLQIPELDGTFHAKMTEAAAAVHDESRAIGGDSGHLQVVGDNLRARIPSTQELLDSGIIDGALTSVLGAEYVLHPHHFVHEAGNFDQGFHQDGNLPWNDRGHYRTHRPNWAMLFYYPQEVLEKSGPTEVLAGSQYWTVDFEQGESEWRRGDRVDPSLDMEDLRQDNLESRDEKLAGSLKTLNIKNLYRERLTVPAGSVVLAHYDLFHRGTRKSPDWDDRRFMYKFYFMRTQDPKVAVWDNLSEKPALSDRHEAIHGVVKRIWAWSRGENECELEVQSDCVNRLKTSSGEDVRVKAAYEVGEALRRGDLKDSVADELLKDDKESVRRAMAHGLGLSGEVINSSLIKALKATDARTRRVATFAAGEARSTETVELLLEILENDSDDLARSNAAYALGNIARSGAEIKVERLLSILMEEPDNTTNGNMTRSTVRESILYAILQVSRNADIQPSTLDRLAEIGLSDHDRYVRGLTFEVLAHYVESDCFWQTTLLKDLLASRFSERPKRSANLS